MTRYTTPTLTWALPFEASYIAAAAITIKQGDIIIEKALSDCTASDSTLSCTLTQEESGKFVADRSAKVQLRCVGTDGKAYASNVETLNVSDVLKEGVMDGAES